MRLIETSHLETWARSLPAKGDFPRWGRNLIWAVIQPDRIRFPSGDAVWLPGFDGVVVCSEQSPFVPYGQSVWELGTEATYQAKANEDYWKRSVDKDGQGKPEATAQSLNRSELTFVFATPRVWVQKEK